MKLFVIGHKEHGKGQFCEIAQRIFGLTHMGTSAFNAQMMFNLMRDTHGYTTVEECHADRKNHRELWFTEIRNFCGEVPHRVYSNILAEHNICEGARNRQEFESGRLHNATGDLIIWIDASERMPLESSDSMELTKDDADIIIPNNGSKEAFEASVVRLLLALYRGTAAHAHALIKLNDSSLFGDMSKLHLPGYYLGYYFGNDDSEPIFVETNAAYGPIIPIELNTSDIDLNAIDTKAMRRGPNPDHVEEFEVMYLKEATLECILKNANFKQLLAQHPGAVERIIAKLSN